jgi:hypothetical protein
MCRPARSGYRLPGVAARAGLGCCLDCATRPDGMPVWFAPILGASWVPVVRPDGVPGGVLPGLPVAVVNALVSFPPGAMGLALVPTRGVAAVAGPGGRLGGGVGLLNPLAPLNVCTRGLGAGRGGLSRGPANPLAAHRAVNTTAPHATTPRISIAASPSTSFRD